MKIFVDSNALESAIKDALQEMREDGAEGFDYKIGEIQGMDLRIVAENKNAADMEIIVNEGPLNITAVVEHD